MGLSLETIIGNYDQEFIELVLKSKRFFFHFNERYSKFLWKNHWKNNKKNRRNSNQIKTNLGQRWIWCNSKHHSDKQEGSVNLTNTPTRNPIQNLLQKQLTFKKTMETGYSFHTLKLSLYHVWQIPTLNPTIWTYMKEYNHQVHLINSANRNFNITQTITNEWNKKPKKWKRNKRS